MLYFYRADLDKARLSCLSLQGDDYFGEPFLDHFRCKRPLTGYLSLDRANLLKVSQIYRFKEYQTFFLKHLYNQSIICSRKKRLRSNQEYGIIEIMCDNNR